MPPRLHDSSVFFLRVQHVYLNLPAGCGFVVFDHVKFHIKFGNVLRIGKGRSPSDYQKPEAA